MNLLLKTSERALISFSSQELHGIASALGEVCAAANVGDDEFRGRFGADRSLFVDLRERLLAELKPQLRTYELVNAWAEPASVMVRAITVHGDPVEMSTSEAEGFLGKLKAAIEQAS